MTDIPGVREYLLGVRAGETDPARVAEECLERIEACRDLNAFLWVNEGAPADAAAAAGRGGPLAGLLVAVKDNIDTAGICTTSGSPVDRDRVPVADAPAWRRLRDEAGAVLAGKTHMSEFADRSHHPELGPVRNPRAPERATGGSSSGSAAAVAAGLAPAALGTDTGGSVRIPSSYCGVVGLKGTVGQVETEGLVPLSTTMDHLGVIARSVDDAALVYERLVPGDVRLTGPDTLRVPRPDPRSARIGVARGYLARAQRGVAATVEEAVRLLGAAGCTLAPVELAEARRWRAAHKTILVREAWRHHEPRLRAGAPYGPVFREAIGAGARIADRRYERALAQRQEAIEGLGAALAGLDALVLPTTPTVAPLADEGRSRVTYTRCTTLAAFTGAPAISVPGGTSRGLPAGVQLVAAHGAEERLLGAAALLEDLLTGEARA